jgi:hypothetical protein
MVINGRLYFMANSNKGIKINLKNCSQRCEHTSLVRFPEPEIVDEIFDIRVGEKNYRVFVNRKLNRVTCNEIVSYDYKGIVLLKNPANAKLTLELAETLFEKAGENEWLDTIRNLRHKALNKKKEIRQSRLLKSKGRPAKENIKKASIWCMNALDNKVYKNRLETIKEAYKEFGEKDVPLKSFARTVGTKLKNITDLYNEKPLKFRTKNTRANFAENFYFAQTRIKAARKQKK